MSLNSTWPWVLRCAAAELIVGLVSLIGGTYMATHQPADDPAMPFTPAIWLFGIWPYVAIAAIGFVLVIYAWHKGKSAKSG